VNRRANAVGLDGGGEPLVEGVGQALLVESVVDGWGSGIELAALGRGQDFAADDTEVEGAQGDEGAGGRVLGHGSLSGCYLRTRTVVWLR
jgi:hypothetical protein